MCKIFFNKAHFKAQNNLQENTLFLTFTQIKFLSCTNMKPVKVRNHTLNFQN